jgi:CRISPR-associated protein Cas5d
MAYGIKFRVWGDYALFSRPELKVERVSYDMITPSAAKGILDCVYWKPAIKWRVDKIHVINPIEFTNIRRNEVSKTASFSEIKKLMKTPEPYCIATNDSRQLRASMVLRDVQYVIEAHFDLTDKAGAEDTAEKHYNIALRRLRKGQFFQKPFLGTREFSAEFEVIESNTDIPKSCYADVSENDLGYMLYSIGYNDVDDSQTQEVNPTFFRAVLRNGILDLTDVEVRQ